MPENKLATEIDEKLDVIIECMHRMDRRDRLRTWGGFLRGLIALIPMAIFLWSAWYFFVHGDEIMKKITSYAAESAAQMTEQKSGEIMEQFKLMFPSQ